VKTVYPVRNPADIAARRRGADPFGGPEPPPKDDERDRPRLPHEHDESASDQHSAAPSQRRIGERAYANATDGTRDTDRGPVMDEVYNASVAPDRSAGGPRR